MCSRRCCFDKRCRPSDFRIPTRTVIFPRELS